jgi:branched-chain amino acid transport system substrate-binding protein
MPFFAGAREAVLSWWNVEHGAKLGVKLELKPFDTRYDTAQTASLWPGVLASTKPVVGFALGGPDTAALQQRLPNDKVPLILGSASNGFGWRPNQWVMSTRPTFVHEVSGFIEWFQKTKVGGSRPVKLAMFTTEASPSFADMGKGVIAYAKANPKMVELVEMVYVEPQPADVTLQLRRVLNAGAELVLVPSSIQQAVAVKRAMQALGKNVPLMFSAHNALTVLEKPLGGMAALEGDYEAHASVVTGSDDTEAKRFYDMLVAKHGLKAPWHAFTTWVLARPWCWCAPWKQPRARTAATSSPARTCTRPAGHPVSGQAQFFGFTGGDIDFSVEAPFPLKDPRINIGQVVGGKLKTVATAVPVPKLVKW